jgi:predicted dehydrogenase
VDRVRLGIIGTGNIAPLNVAGYLAHDRCDVVAVCDPRREKATRMAEAWGVPKVYDSIDAILADDEIDAVEILTPTFMHKDHVIAAARAGKHISTQKPIANSVADAREMIAAVEAAGVVFRVTENAVHYPPLVKARELIAAGAIGTPTMIRIKTVVGRSDNEFQANLEPEGYTWRFDAHSPGGHLFDDIVHKYAVALWLVEEQVRSVQAIVRRGPLFFETPTAAIWEYDRDDLLGMMEVTYAPRMHIRSDYWGADEFFEIQGTDGFIWVTQFCGKLHDLPSVMLYEADGRRTSFAGLDDSYMRSFTDMSASFVDSLLDGTQPSLSGDLATRVLQLCFAVYEASNTRGPVDPRSITGSVSPPWWPPTQQDLFRDAYRLGQIPPDILDNLPEEYRRLLDDA